VHEDEQGRARAGTRRLPPEALVGLRQACARELAERLPRLRAATRDAPLRSSAAVVGEASRTARRAEVLLLGARPVDAPACHELRRHVDALGEHLATWRL
jgi:hypothetical protein